MSSLKCGVLRGVYSVLITLLLPIAFFRLWGRGRKQPGYREAWPERLGFYRQSGRAPLIWIHAVSVGETHAAQPLVRALQARHPQHQILLTHMTPTGRAAGKMLFGDSIVQCYLPYDLPWAVHSFLRHYQPVIGVLMETEIWFNLSAACRAHRIPLYLVNARMSERSARHYAWARILTREALRGLGGIAAQTESDAARLHSLGASAVTVTGNMKFDGEPSGDTDKADFRERFGQTRPIFLAASTRDGEEEIVLDAFAKIATPDLLLVIVPRHPQRFDQVANMLRQRGIAFQRRTGDSKVAAATRVLLGDSMGEMAAYYAACDVAFVGGSLLPLGGQNLIEACAAGRPVLIGPHTFNFSKASDSAVTAGAALRVRDAKDLASQVGALLADRARAQRMGKAGIDFCAAHRGATARTMEILGNLTSRVDRYR